MSDPHPAFPVRPPRRGVAPALMRACRPLWLAPLLLLPFQALAAPGDAVLMEVRQVVVDPVHRTPVVVLTGGGRLLPIWIGAGEATSIARALEGQAPSRPNTHDLIGNLLKGLRATPERITITELRDTTYFAVITLRAGRRRIAVDSRPSDAIAVALRTGAPIYATTQVLENTARLNDPALRSGEGVTRMMGMHIQDLTAELGKLFATDVREGVLVAHVDRDSAAAGHGFRRGDVIVGVDGEPVRNTRRLHAVMASRPGTGRRTFRIQRDGEPVTIVVDPPSREKP